MSKFTNPLDSVRIASPCSANWNEMYGDERKRYCAECKLNVYNLSDMTKKEAENFLINSEGRVCVKFYRRKDRTVLTQNCPVGWRAIKRTVSQTATAFFSICFGILSGLFAFNQTMFDKSDLIKDVVVDSDVLNDSSLLPIDGQLKNLDKTKIEINKKRDTSKRKLTKRGNYEAVLGRVENIRRLEDEPVVAWIK